jgi:hypothetical protein
VSDTFVVPLVTLLVAVLFTVIFHTAVWPCVKVPVCILDTDNEGAGKIVILSDPEVLLTPAPPVTLAWLLIGDPAVAETLTLSVSVG